eukprot:m51a1_g14028 hypothetical protein (321) ;mRNA; f:1122170-1123245
MLARATEGQQQDIDRHTFAMWGSPLSLEQYLHREAVSRACCTANLPRTQWALVSPVGQVLSSFEWFRHDCRSPDGVEGHLYAIASVFTPETERGHGHAARMLREALALAAAEDPRALAAVLYSDIGTYYSRCSFAHADADPTDLVAPASRNASAPGATPVVWSSAEAGALMRGAWERDAQAAMSVLLPAEKLEWFYARESAHGRCCSAGQRHSFGARCSSSDAFAVWAPHGPELHAELHGSEDADLAALLACAQAEAGRLGLGLVRVWTADPRGAPVPGWALSCGASRQDRGHSIPMLATLREGVCTTGWIGGLGALHWV